MKISYLPSQSHVSSPQPMTLAPAQESLEGLPEFWREDGIDDGIQG